MLNGRFHRSRPAILNLEQIAPIAADPKQLLVVDIPTDLLLACTWAAVGLVVSMSMAIAFPMADPYARLLALG